MFPRTEPARKCNFGGFWWLLSGVASHPELMKVQLMLKYGPIKTIASYLISACVVGVVVVVVVAAIVVVLGLVLVLVLVLLVVSC